MEAEGSNRNLNNLRKKSDKSRRICTLREEETLIAALKDIITKGWKSENGFRTGYLNALEQYMIKALPGTNLRVEPHINSKVHVWKKYHGSLSTMLSRSGFEWNDSVHMITVESDDVWNNYVKTDAIARAMRYKPFPFYFAWCEIFGKDQATGEHAEDCTAVASNVLETNLNKESEQAPTDWINGANFIFEDYNADKSMCLSKESANVDKNKSKKRKSSYPTDEKFVEIIGKYYSDTNQRLGEIAKRIGYEFNASQKRSAVYEALGRLSELGMSQKIYVAKLLVNNNKDLDLFFSLPDEERLEMVRMMIAGEM